MARRAGPAHANIGVGRARDLERAAGGCCGGMRVPTGQLPRDGRPAPMRQDARKGPLDDVIERVARPEVVAVEHEPGARCGAVPVCWPLRDERHGRAQPHQGPLHGGRLKMMTIPFATDTMDGRPSDSGVSWRSMVEPPVGSLTSPITSPMAGTTSRAPAESNPVVLPRLVGSVAPAARSTASTTVPVPPPLARPARRAPPAPCRPAP